MHGDLRAGTRLAPQLQPRLVHRRGVLDDGKSETRAAELAVRCEALVAENENLRASAKECTHLKEHIADIEIKLAEAVERQASLEELGVIGGRKAVVRK